MTNFKRYLFIGVWLGFAVAAHGRDGQQEGSTELSRTANGDWSLQVRHANLPAVIAKIATQTGTKVHYSVLPEAAVDATCVGAEASELLLCLLGAGANMVFRQSENGRDGEIWIMGSSLIVSPRGGDCVAAAHVVMQDESGKPDLVALTKQWLRQASVENTAQRAQAVAELANADPGYDAEVKAVLSKAVVDSKPQVRVQAIGAIASREGEAGASEQLRQALGDSVVDVKLTALDYIQQDVALLQLAAQDSNEAVRQLAEMKLEQLARR